MTLPDAPTVPTSLIDSVREKIKTAAAPLKLADVAKGLPKPRKLKADAFRQQLRDLLDEEVRLGGVFVHPSGSKGELRYWTQDEKRQLRDKALSIGDEPQELSKLQKALGKGLDSEFVATIVRELVSEGRLFAHPPKTKKGKPRFASSPPPPPPPPLATKPHKAKLDKLIADSRKLLAASGVGADELLRALRMHIVEITTPVSLPAETPEELILKAASHAPVLSLADLRREMPGEFRGRAFDDAVLRLADQHQVVLSQDADPSSFSPAELAELVRDGGALYTTLALRR